MDSTRERFKEIIAPFLGEGSASCSGRRVLAAVSGGADSVFLLALLESLSKTLGFSLAAITVNHGLRPEEGAGDAAFVEAMCASFSPPVKCFRAEFEAGSVEKEASKRGMGIEEAARFLRYKAFEKVAAEWGADCVMTAHTASDRVETALMRFLQGAGVSQGSSILPLRKCGKKAFFFRPMLTFSGEEVRSFLKEEGIAWREDSTNADSRFLRNRIRHKVLPLLDREFPGWRGAVLCGAEKSAMDAALLDSLPLPEWRSFPPSSLATDDSGKARLLFCNATEYSALPFALRLRFLYKGAAQLGLEGRVPYRLLRQMVYAQGGESANGAGFFFELAKRYAFIGRDIVQMGKNGYLVVVRGECAVPLPFGEIKMHKAGDDDLLAVECGEGEGALAKAAFKPPFVIRSKTADDFIEGKGGEQRSLKKLFSGWGVPAFLRSCIPVIEERGKVSAVLGSCLGFPDFIAERQNQRL